MKWSFFDKKHLSVLLPPFLGLVMAIIVLSTSFNREKTSYENLAFGKYITAIQTTKHNQRITCMNLEDSDSCLNNIVNDKHVNVALWLGNSQLHGIMDYKNGDQNAPSVLFNYLKRKKVRLVSFSPPNGNMLEHRIILKYVQTKIPIKYLIISAVFDDFRENDVRSTIMTKWEEQKNQKNQKNQQSKPEQKFKKTFSLTSFLTVPLNDEVERRLELWMTEQFDIWEKRSEARGTFFVSLYKFRNEIFSINSQSKRKKVNSSYMANMSSFRDILAFAHENGIKVLVYIAPIRKDINMPYVVEEYNQFENDIKALTQKMQAYYVNLESLVPAEFWNNCSGGNDEFDFMHFKAEGHALLAKAINKQFKIRMLKIN